METEINYAISELEEHIDAHISEDREEDAKYGLIRYICDEIEKYTNQKFFDGLMGNCNDESLNFSNYCLLPLQLNDNETCALAQDDNSILEFNENLKDNSEFIGECGEDFFKGIIERINGKSSKVNGNWSIKNYSDFYLNDVYVFKSRFWSHLCTNHSDISAFDAIIICNNFTKYILTQLNKVHNEETF